MAQPRGAMRRAGTVKTMARTEIPFRLRSETLGFDGPNPWSLPALHLLFSAPRVYEPLVVGWERRHKGTRRALDRLVGMGFVAYQPPIIMNTVTGEVAERVGRPATRYRATAAGLRLLEAIADDSGVLQEFTPKTSPKNRLGVQRLLEAVAIDSTVAPDGVSAAYAAQQAGMSERTARWWLGRLVEKGVVRELDRMVADTREVIPAHWRATRLLARHLTDIANERELPGAPGSLVTEFRLQRSRFLGDIVPERVGLGGATDYDHDVGTQEVVSELLRSPRFQANGIFVVEPRFAVPIFDDRYPWEFHPAGTSKLYYQPDVEYREMGRNGIRRAILEYERYQTRRDGWEHLERFLGWLRCNVLPFESAVLRFVVASQQRARSYTELIEAFADWLMRRPDLRPVQEVQLEVISRPQLAKLEDTLDERGWYRISLPRYQGEGKPRALLHPESKSPYDEYF